MIILSLNMFAADDSNPSHAILAQGVYDTGRIHGTAL